MRTFRCLFFFVGLLICSIAHTQSFEVPAHYEFKVAADYTRYEKDIILAADWLKNTPFDEEKSKRKEVSAFVVQWINGSPSVNVEINQTILDFEKKNKGMLALYMASSAKYVLQNNYSKDMRAKQIAALRDMISAYKANKGINKDKKMETLIKRDDEGKINDWLDENLKIQK